MPKLEKGAVTAAEAVNEVLMNSGKMEKEVYFIGGSAFGIIRGAPVKLASVWPEMSLSLEDYNITVQKNTDDETVLTLSRLGFFGSQSLLASSTPSVEEAPLFAEDVPLTSPPTPMWTPEDDSEYEYQEKMAGLKL